MALCLGLSAQTIKCEKNQTIVSMTLYPSLMLFPNSVYAVMSNKSYLLESHSLSYTLQLHLMHHKAQYVQI